MTLFRYAIILFLVLISLRAHALKPEDVLGEYWKDPLFGQASSELNVDIHIQDDGLWISDDELPASKTIRFVVTNKTAELHLLAFSAHPNELKRDPRFIEFIREDVWHATVDPIYNGQHTHADTELENPKPLVKYLNENPTIIVRPGEFKEALIRFESGSHFSIFCALPHADESTYTVELKIYE